MSGKSLTEITQAAGITTASKLTSELRGKAISQGWPAEAARGVSVVFSGGAFDIKIASSVDDLVQTLEYGTEDTPPNPVIRSFSLRSQRTEKAFVAEWQRRAGWTV